MLHQRRMGQPLRLVLDARTIRRSPSGIGRYVAALVARLPALAPQHHFVLWTHPERPDAGHARTPNVSTEVVRAPGDGLGTLMWPARLGSTRGDVTHLPANLLGRGLGPAVVTVHDLMWLEHPHWVEGRPLLRPLRRAYYVAGARHALARAERLLAVSRATADRILRVDPAAAARTVVTPLAAAPMFRPPDDPEVTRARVARVLGHTRPYFLVVGKNEPYKAHEVALAAFARGARPDDELVFVQRGRGARRLAARARALGVAARVRFLAQVGAAELVALFAHAQALLQPSRMEGFGLPALEAMSAGCPVVASDTPALVEVLGGAGLHAPVGDVRATAAAIRAVQDPVRRAELRAAGLERAAEFDWERTARTTLEVYEEVGSA